MRTNEFALVPPCTLPANVPHEMLSPYENTDQQMHWLGGLLSVSVEFVADGRFIESKMLDEKRRAIGTECPLN